MHARAVLVRLALARLHAAQTKGEPLLHRYLAIPIFMFFVSLPVNLAITPFQAFRNIGHADWPMRIVYWGFTGGLAFVVSLLALRMLTTRIPDWAPSIVMAHVMGTPLRAIEWLSRRVIHASKEAPRHG